MNRYLEKIAGMILIQSTHQGALHKQLGVPSGDRISDRDLSTARAKAKKTGDQKLLRRVVFAQNARKWNHKKKRK